MPQPVRVGIVGAGFAARFHFDGLRRVFGVPVEIVGVTSKATTSCNIFARDRGIRSFDSFADLSAAVDVVDLCTPPSSHEHLAPSWSAFLRPTSTACAFWGTSLVDTIERLSPSDGA